MERQRHEPIAAFTRPLVAAFSGTKDPMQKPRWSAAAGQPVLRATHTLPVSAMATARLLSWWPARRLFSFPSPS
jgi:hypothetical protein